MDIAQAVAYLIVACILLALTLLAILRLGFFRLESSTGIARDGLAIGTAAPALSVTDLTANTYDIPSKYGWQLLVFSDRALLVFPGVVSGINTLHAIPATTKGKDRLQVLILSRDGPEQCQAIVEGLELEAPMCSVDQIVYNRFRVRVGPFASLIDPQGVVQWKGLINTEEQMLHAWNLTRTLFASRDMEVDATP